MVREAGLEPARPEWTPEPEWVNIRDRLHHIIANCCNLYANFIFLRTEIKKLFILLKSSL